MKTVKELADLSSREEINLLSHASGFDITLLLAHPEQKIEDKKAARFRLLLKRFKQGEPLAYILKEKSFFNSTFRVSPAVLIPRPESEIIVEKALEKINKRPAAEKICCLDIGTGSGAIILSVAAALKRTARYLGGDISASALNIAKHNRKNLKLQKKVIFRQGDLLLPFMQEKADFFFIAANLPYLNPAERKKEPSIAKEPDIALLGGKDGLSIYRRLLAGKNLKFLKQQRFLLVMEINPGQYSNLLAIAKKSFPFAKIRKTSDLRGQTRFLEIESM